MSPTEPTRESVVDEFYRLDAQVKSCAPLLNRHKKLREVILAWFPDLPPDQATSVSGIEGVVMIGERQMEREPASMAKVCKLFGRTEFFAACSITIKAMVGKLGEPLTNSVLVEKQTGPRKLTAIPKAPLDAPAKAA